MATTPAERGHRNANAGQFHALIVWQRDIDEGREPSMTANTYTSRQEAEDRIREWATAPIAYIGLISEGTVRMVASHHRRRQRDANIHRNLIS